jgi:anti-sigma factor RsiW
MTMAVTEEMIMAYADGELDATGAAQVEAAMAADAEIVRQVEAHRSLRASFAGAFAGVLNEPVPERLVAAASKPTPTADNVVSLANFRSRSEPAARQGPSRWAQFGAIAATLMVGLFVGRLWMVQPSAPLAVGQDGAIAARGQLATALNDQLASGGQAGNGAAGDQAVKIGVSFRSTDNSYCRTFQLNQGRGVAGVACREPKGWAVRMAMASAPQSASAGYRTAGTETPTPVLEAIQSMIAGDPLNAKGEAAAKAAGWRL